MKEREEEEEGERGLIYVIKSPATEEKEMIHVFEYQPAAPSSFPFLSFAYTHIPQKKEEKNALLPDPATQASRTFCCPIRRRSKRKRSSGKEE
jgi:hypothetical protein